MTAPRVLHVAQPTDGGVGRYVLDACADQRARGWTVALACPPSPLATRAAATGATWLPWAATRSPGPRSLAETFALARVVAEARPDVVHLHSSKAGLAGRLAIRGRRPTLFQPHGWSWLAVTGALRAASGAWERHAVRWADVVVCVGEAERALGRAAGIGGDLRVVRNGVDRRAFPSAGPVARRAARAALRLDPDAPLALCAGRVTRQKGQDVLLAAWPLVRATCPRARLALVGAGEPGGDREGVWFRPPTDDVRRWLAAADVVVVPSRWEGLPLVALEAAATGRSIVATTAAGLAELLDPGTTALVPPEDPTALAAALVSRLADPALAAAEGLALAGRAERFDQRRTLDELAALTLDAAGQPAVAR